MSLLACCLFTTPRFANEAPAWAVTCLLTAVFFLYVSDENIQKTVFFGFLRKSPQCEVARSFDHQHQCFVWTFEESKTPSPVAFLTGLKQSWIISIFVRDNGLTWFSCRSLNSKVAEWTNKIRSVYPGTHLVKADCPRSSWKPGTSRGLISVTTLHAALAAPSE